MNMFDLDLCNDCHQSVGIPCILVYLLYVNEVSYLVRKPFIPLSSLSEKLCWSVLEIRQDAHLFSVVENSILFSYAARFARSVLMCGCILQVSENRRRGGRHAQQDEVPQQQQLPPPPSMSIEQMFLMQTQAVQAIGQTLAAIQQQQQQQPPPQPQMPKDKRAEFMRGHPQRLLTLLTPWMLKTGYTQWSESCIPLSVMTGRKSCMVLVC
jgi:hypothetical protein